MQRVLKWSLIGLSVIAVVALVFVGTSSQRCVTAPEQGTIRLMECQVATTVLGAVMRLEPSVEFRLAPVHMARGQQLAYAGQPDAAVWHFAEAYRLAQRDPNKVYELQSTRTMRDLLITIQVKEPSDEVRNLWWGGVLAQDPIGARALIKYGERNQ